MSTTNIDQLIDPLLGDDASVHGSLPTYTQVITDHPAATKQKSLVKKPAAASKKRKISKPKEAERTPASEHDAKDEVQIVNCDTGFRFYVLDRLKKGKKTWVVIASEESFNIPITASPKDQATTYADFFATLSAHCEAVEPNTGRIVSEYVEKKKDDIVWTVLIPRVPGFMKGKPFVLKNKEGYNKWIESLEENKSDVTSLFLKMKNPTSQAKRAHNAEVLAKEAIRTKTKRMVIEAKEAKRADDLKSGKRDLDEDNDDLDDLDDNEDTDCDAVKLMIQSKRGVSLQSPPNELRYEKVSAKRNSSKANAAAIRGGAQSNCGGCCNSLQHQHQTLAHNPVSSDGPCPQPGPNAGIDKYVKFIGLRQPARISEILVENDMTNYKTFRSQNLDKNLLKDIGLTVGVVTQLVDNVPKFERHLARQEQH
ncbi:hypothetical protein PtA15_2A748 [Puccinia triticina]|uniref:SAM domain-containing protein n=1 Tax=Puccinia triticina TaxID=208348 RepID=A0ABY7CB60_9BASI|nr:uncharacterized protein PtA15_2A748 [Puccinia triticina]WAQ82431.1 hypothetical protein PtA15_2A748 [Puccinia triticina]